MQSYGRLPVDATVAILFDATVVFETVHHACHLDIIPPPRPHLTEDENATVLLLQLRQQLVLATVLPEMGALRERRTLHINKQSDLPGSAPSNRYGWLQTLRNCMRMFCSWYRLGPLTLLSASTSYGDEKREKRPCSERSCTRRAACPSVRRRA